MDIKEFFADNGIAYANVAQGWINNYFLSVNHVMEHSFAYDFALADWSNGIEGIDKTYEKVKQEWLDDYRAFTEVVLNVNMMSWFYDQIIRQGVTREDVSCEDMCRKYADMYHKATSDFYAKYEDNQEACDWFFDKTD